MRIPTSAFYKAPKASIPVGFTDAAALMNEQGVASFAATNDSANRAWRDALRDSVPGTPPVCVRYLLFCEADYGCDVCAPAPSAHGYDSTPTGFANGDAAGLPESAFLHNAAGQRLFYKGDTGHYYHAANPASRDWRDLVKLRCQSAAISQGWDGYFYDNFDWKPAPKRWANSGGAWPKEYPSLKVRDWQNDLLSYLAEVRGWLGNQELILNFINSAYTGNEMAQASAYADGVMIEDFAVGYPPNYSSVSVWTGQMTQIEALLESGKSVIAVAQGDHSDTARMNYAIASALLVAAPELSLRLGTGYNTMNLYPESVADYGAPLGARTPSADGTWTRQFESGLVSVNPSTRAFSLPSVS